jgi:hypothetical protein
MLKSLRNQYEIKNVEPRSVIGTLQKSPDPSMIPECEPTALSDASKVAFPYALRVAPFPLESVSILSNE